MSQPSFNFDKAIQYKSSPFKAFDVEDDFMPLSDAIQQGDIEPDNPVLVAERASSIIVLDRREMSYHHVAQGEMNGEPWMVVF